MMYVEPDTWCNPLYSIGPIYDLMVEAWDRRANRSPVTDKQYYGVYGVTQREIDGLHKLVEHAIYMSLQDVKGMRALIEKIKAAHINEYINKYGNGAWSSYPSRKELAARRLDPMPEIYNLQHVPNFVLNFLADFPFPPPMSTGVNLDKRLRHTPALYYFDKYRVEEAELAWRVKDAGDAAKSQLRGRDRIAAFEAMWLAGQEEHAYAFVGAKLPPLWTGP